MAYIFEVSGQLLRELERIRKDTGNAIEGQIEMALENWIRCMEVFAEEDAERAGRLHRKVES